MTTTPPTRTPTPAQSATNVNVAAAPASSASMWTATRVIALVFTVLEVLLLVRFAFKLLGANADQPFASAIYGITEPLVAPFRGIFAQPAGTPIVEVAALRDLARRLPQPSSSLSFAPTPAEVGTRTRSGGGNATAEPARGARHNDARGDHRTSQSEGLEEPRHCQPQAHPSADLRRGARERLRKWPRRAIAEDGIRQARGRDHRAMTEASCTPTTTALTVES